MPLRFHFFILGSYSSILFVVITRVPCNGGLASFFVSKGERINMDEVNARCGARRMRAGMMKIAER